MERGPTINDQVNKKLNSQFIYKIFLEISAEEKYISIYQKIKNEKNDFKVEKSQMTHNKIIFGFNPTKITEKKEENSKEEKQNPEKTLQKETLLDLDPDILNKKQNPGL